jgi:uncharacterized membrane protein (DUF485 family)
MLHEPAIQGTEDHAAAYKTRLGVWMFFFYALFYVGFVAINLVAPALMEARVVLGLNLATAYGFGLIILALVMALIYSAMCSRREAALDDRGDGGATPDRRVAP